MHGANGLRSLRERPYELLRELDRRARAAAQGHGLDLKPFATVTRHSAPGPGEKTVELKPGTVRRMQELSHQLRWDILFVTQRPSTAGRTTQLQTQRWLHKHGFDLPAVYTTKGSRGRSIGSMGSFSRPQDFLELDSDPAAAKIEDPDWLERVPPILAGEDYQPELLLARDWGAEGWVDGERELLPGVSVVPTGGHSSFVSANLA